MNWIYRSTLGGIGLAGVKKFNLDDNDYYAIGIAQNAAYSFLKYPHIKSKQVIGLGNALYALERLPLTTEGVCCEFGLVYRDGDETFNEMRYITFRISDDDFGISQGGSVNDESVGGDSYSDPSWYVDINGNRETECQLWSLEDTIAEYMNLGAKIIVNDESCVEYEDESDNYKLEYRNIVYKDKIIEYVAEEACKKVSRKVIRGFQEMTEGMQYGDDSPLKNVWDEICAQVQGEQSFMWGVYLDTIRQFIGHELELLDRQIKQAIWLQTNEGSDWEYDNEENEQEEDSVPFCEDEIVKYILQDYILQSAANWNNEQIEEYFDNRYDFDQ